MAEKDLRTEKPIRVSLTHSVSGDFPQPASEGWSSTKAYPDGAVFDQSLPRRGGFRPKLKTFIRSFGFAFEGIGYSLRTQRNMRVHLALGLLAVGLGLWLGLRLTEWAVLLVVMALVYCLEMFNTVIEAVVDLVTDRYHPLAKIAKDVAAGAVLVAAIFALIIGLLLFGPRLFQVVLHFL